MHGWKSDVWEPLAAMRIFIIVIENKVKALMKHVAETALVFLSPKSFSRKGN